MSIFVNQNGIKKVTGMFANVNGEKKKILSAWVNKDGVATKVWGAGGSTVNIYILTCASNLVYYSYDFENWTPVDIVSDGSRRVLIHDKKILISSNGRILYSENALEYEIVEDTDSVMSGITYGMDRYVCVGDSSKSYYSLDGKTWNAMTGIEGILIDVCYGNDRFVCVLFSKVTKNSYYSTDGETWNAMSGLSSSSRYMSVCYGMNRFVCVGEYGVSYYSTDGATWKAMSGTGYYFLRGVCYGMDRFVCVGDYGVSYYSTDGVTWNAMSGLDASSGEEGYMGVSYIRNKFVAVGKNGMIYVSTDGVTWSKHKQIGTSKFWDIQYGEIIV